MTNTRNHRMLKRFSLTPIFVWGIMILDISLQYLFGKLPSSIRDYFIGFGIWLAFFFLLMCAFSPLIGIGCGTLGLIYAKKGKTADEPTNKWLVLSIADIVIATLSFFPFANWLAAAFSGQI